MKSGATTHNEAVMATVVTVEKAVASLEEEKAALRVIVIGRDAEHAESLPLAKEFLLPGVHTMLGGCLKKTVKTIQKIIFFYYTQTSADQYQY